MALKRIKFAVDFKKKKNLTWITDTSYSSNVAYSIVQDLRTRYPKAAICGYLDDNVLAKSIFIEIKLTNKADDAFFALGNAIDMVVEADIHV